MAVPLEAFLGDSYIAGSFDGSPAQCRAVLHDGATVDLSDVSFVPISELTAGTAERAPVGSVGPDDILIVALPPDPDAPTMHSVRYPVQLTAGPYVVTGDLAMFPGFDPARALTRPASGFIDLHGATVRIATADGEIEQEYDELTVNRFAVEHVVSEIDMTFWFPGAVQELIPEE